MKRTIKLFIFWILIYIPIAIFLVVFVSFNQKHDNTPNKYINIQKFVGARLVFNNLLDRENNEVGLKTSVAITLIDFWYGGCAPCLKEMKEFNSLISGMGEKINIVSISIDGTGAWNSLFQKDSPIPFLKEETLNWKHFNLIDSTFLTANNKLIAKGSGLDFTKELGLTSFPSYLVLDNTGVLVDLPNSGVVYIKKKLYNQSDFRIFWTTPQNRDILKKMFLGAFVFYSLIYWLIILILIQRRKMKSTVANN